MKLRKSYLIVGLLVIPLGLGVYKTFYGSHSNTALPTDVENEAAAVTSPENRPYKHFIKAEGRVTTYPAAQVELSTEIAGTIERMLVQEKQAVHKGELLAELRDNEERAALEEAKARFTETKAHLWYYEQEVKRAQKLASSKTISTDALERAQRDRDVAKAKLVKSRAAVDRLQAVLDKTLIKAPIDGVIVARYLQGGETVQARVPIFKIADLSRLRIEAEVDEYETARLALGDAVKISSEGYKQTWKGKVEEIPDIMVRKRGQPEDPARPTDTRVLLVKIALLENTPLKLGQRVEIEIIQSGVKSSGGKSL